MSYKDFQPWEKPWQHTWKNILVFTCVWYRQSAAYSPLAPLGRVDQWTTKPSQFSILSSLSEFFADYGCQNTEYSVSLTDSDVQAFLEREEHQIRKEKAKVTYSVALVVAFLRLRTKTTNERFATNWFWPCIWKISFVGKDKINNWEFCILKFLSMVCFCSVPTHFFTLSLSANALLRFLSGDCRSIH